MFSSETEGVRVDELILHKLTGTGPFFSGDSRVQDVDPEPH